MRPAFFLPYERRFGVGRCDKGMYPGQEIAFDAVNGCGDGWIRTHGG
jgi:hypothetical protein